MEKLTANSVRRAYSKALKGIEQDGSLNSLCVSAGRIIPSGQRKGGRYGYEIFVTACRWSEELADEMPDTRGLICDMPHNKK
jgi:hypothetical protein